MATPYSTCSNNEPKHGMPGRCPLASTESVADARLSQIRSGSGVATFVFISDNFHTYRHLRRSATRMHTLSIRDLTPHETHTYLSGTHERLFPSAPPVTPAQSLKIWDMIGGRLSFLSKVVKSHNLEESARELVSEYKEWLHSRVGLIPDCDDDVMDEQKVSYCSFVSRLVQVP